MSIDVGTLSKVSERLLWLKGKRVAVRVAYAEIGQMGGESFNALYEDVLPLGREYFFVFRVSNARVLIRTSTVIEVREIDSDAPTMPSGSARRELERNAADDATTGAGSDA